MHDERRSSLARWARATGARGLRLALLALLATAGCRGPASEPKHLFRFLEGEPVESAARRSPALSELPDREAARAGLEALRVADTCELERREGIATVSCAGRSAVVVGFGGAIAADGADGADVLIATLGGIGREGVALHWRDELGGEHALVDLDVQPAGGRAVDFSFRMRGREGWLGTVSGLELRVDRPASGHLEIHGIRRARLEPAAPGTYPRRERLDLDREVRNAVVLLPGQSLEWAPPLPKGAFELRFGIGAESRLPATTRFRVVLEENGGNRELFASGVEKAGSWQSESVAFETSGAPGARLRFEVIADEGGDGTLGVAGFAHPEIRARVDESMRPNLALIVVDTLRADRLSAYGYARNTSPSLTAWMERRGGTLFRRAVAQAPWTLPAHVSLFTGLDVQNHGAVSSAPVPRDLGLLAEQLREAGYSTCAVTGGGFVHPYFGFARGFDRYAYHSLAGSGESDLVEGLERAARCLDEIEPPYFFFFHTYEVHNPYLPRAPFFAGWSRFTPRHSIRVEQPERDAAHGYLERRTIRAGGPDADRFEERDRQELLGDLYDSGVAFADQKLDQLFARLDAEDARRPTWAVFTSDHGEALGEHGRTNHTSLDQGVLAIPLVIVPPASATRAPRTIERQVRQIDLAPTFLDWAGVAAAREPDGSSLRPFLEGAEAPDRDAWSYVPTTGYGIALTRGDGWRYVMRDLIWPGREPWEQLVDLSGDPAELVDRLASEPAMAGEMRSEVRRELARARRGLLVEVESTGPPWRFEISIPGGSVDRFKAIDGPDESATLVGDGRLGAEIRTGKPLRLFVDGDPGSPIEVVVSGGAGEAVPGARYAIEAKDLAGGPRSYALRGGKWGTGEGAGATASIRLERRGRAGKAEAEGRADSAVEEELRSLGYLR